MERADEPDDDDYGDDYDIGSPSSIHPFFMATIVSAFMLSVVGPVVIVVCAVKLFF